MSSLNFHYTKVLTPLLIEKYNLNTLGSIPQVNRLLVVSTSKEVLTNQNVLFNTLILLELIACQYSSIVRAKRSVAAFKLRKGVVLGGKTTLLNTLLWQFIERIALIVLPSLKEFKGLSFTVNSVREMDKLNCVVTLGLKQINCFVEIESKADKIKSNQGLTFSLLVKSSSMNMTRFLLNGLQMSC